jgi:membrane protease YdiL (CAAX protease family)
VAALVSALSFGAAPMMQGWRSSAFIVLFGLNFQAVVWLSGSLYVAVAVHVAYDITVGLAYTRRVRELGVHPEPRKTVAVCSERLLPNAVSPILLDLPGP